MSIVQLTHAQRRQLHRFLQCAQDASHYRRLLALLELDCGQSVAEVAQMLDVTRQSVYNWASCFLASSDPTSLEDHYGIGRPSAWTEDLVTLLQTSLQQRPADLGYLAMNWTVRLLQEHLYRCGGRRLSENTIRRQLDDRAMSGSGFAMSCRPIRSARKKRAIRRRLRALPPGSVKLAEDETDLRLFPPLRAGWARRGE